MTIRRYELTDEEWGQIKDHIPTSKMGRPPKNHRQMLNAILWLARSGAMWGDLPERYGPWKTVYSRFCKWRDTGVLETIFAALNMDVNIDNLCIDSASVRANKLAANTKKGLPETKETRK